ncbi:MAG: class I poly(R)-hydroxyalkanoic acid synthase [Betaproteobacteria bacterium]|nr:class I poly(R)-hydroxyalkanoic acid synthase [Betaproteobacteria bacterium]MDE2003081.1 class I poly(R)-hydroxyalkanoic acid synthase [Betaproteobacteria bacterium]MDE2208746.1 class I poly(R)-hydroxyalkanoic acid synthase [Betaproteobacteria bacterium]
MATPAPTASAAAAPGAASYDPMALAESLASAAEKSAKLMGEFAARHAGSHSVVPGDELGLGQAFMELAAKMLTNPARLAEGQMNLWRDYMSLWQSSMLRMMGAPAIAVAEPAKGDRRFKDAGWQEHFLFDYVKQSYLIAARWMHEQVASVEGMPEPTKKKIDFFTRQYIDALAPSNFALTNPEVFRETVASGGQNLVRGLHNLLDDIERGNGQLRISMTDSKAFELGVNIATTPGKVVFQNDLMQLIQYEPATKKQWKRPLLIIPPWINKYYILDLREKNSLIRWAVHEGMTVFVVSWVNPDERLAHKDFEDYLIEGPIAALDAIEKATGEPDANVVGYCLGGTLLAATLGWLAAKGQKRIASATFMTALIDFTAPGELEVFIDEDQVRSLERKMKERGYLEGSEMANTFNLLRANDLIWSFVINNYLMGRDPFPFDLLHWNCDSTRMPATMHSYYLRNMYMNNRLREPGGLNLAGVPIDLSKVTTPSYFVSAIEDHIAPWKATYAGPRLLKGKSRFVLSGSGHIAGMINPPAAHKYAYWTNDKLPASADRWLADATQHDGSWWTDWRAWIASHAGREVPARVPGKGKLPIVEPAPGSYARQRADAG